VPELPEVETVVRSIAPHIVGQRIEHVEIRLPRIFKGEPPVGRTILNVTRYGKFIVMALAPGGFLIVHLGMTGKLRWNAPREKHTHVIITLESGELSYTDARTFGRIESSDELPERVARLGPDALAVPQAEFIERLRQRTGKIKSRLLNQMFLRGLGNIYADEALFRAGIHPGARTVSKKRAIALHTAVQEVLAAAVEARGSSISDYVDADNQRGTFQTEHRVYGRKGEPCLVCGTPIRRMVITQRSSHYCPKCQRR
jgi:formamidopyrimidine-DNA glycosylase